MNKSAILFQIVSLFWIPVLSFSQQNTSVTIKDHNSNSGIVNIDCNYKFIKPDQKVILSANVPEIKNTLEYNVDYLPYSSEGQFSEGKEIKISKDDQWSQIIQFPQGFNFCYYETNYDSFVIGDNGVVSFDKSKTGTYCPPTFEGKISSLPSELSANTIFGSYHDLVYVNGVKGCTGDCGQIYVNVTGNAPFRKVVINFNKMNHFNCAEKKSTFQIVLHETTNIIDINIEDKPITCKATSDIITKTLVGITDSEGKGVAPESRNSGEWEAKNESWRFIPKGTVTPTLQWYNIDDKGKEIAISGGTKPTLDVYPTKLNIENPIYRLKVFYEVCGLEYLSNDIKFVFANDFPVAEDKTGGFCYDTSFPSRYVELTDLILQSIGTQDIQNVTVYTSQEAADLGDKSKAIDFTHVHINKESVIFYLRLEKGENCYTTAKITVSLLKKPEIIYKEPIEVCLNENKIPKVLDLKLYSSEITIGGNVEYYYTESDAKNGINEVKEIPIQLNTPITLYAKVYVKEVSDCLPQVVPVVFIIKPSFDVIDDIIKICDLKEICIIPKEYERLYGEKADEYEFSYYMSWIDAIKGNKNKQIKPEEKFCLALGQKIYVRMEKEGYCPGIGEISVGATPPRLSTLDKKYCENPYGGITEKLNLNTLVNKELFRDDTSFILYDIFENGVKIDKNQYEEYEVYNSTSLRVSYHDNKSKCDFEVSINISFNLRASNIISSYDVCDMENNGEEFFYLNNLTNTILTKYSKGSKVDYYLSQQDIDNNNGSVESILLKKDQEQYIYAKVTALNCYFIHKIKLSLINFDFPEIKNPEILICDQNQDGVEKVNLYNYKSSIIDTPDIYEFIYYKNQEDLLKGQNEIKFKPNEPGIYETKIPNILYVKVKLANDSSPCYRISELKITNYNKIEVQDILVDKCADNLSLVYMVNLVAETEKMKLGDTKNLKLKITYYRTEQEANNLTIKDGTITENLTAYEISSSEQQVWVRFLDNEKSCYVVRKMDIKLRSIPKIVSGSYWVCDDDFDGVYKVKLENLNTELINDVTGLKFEYLIKNEHTGSFEEIKEEYIIGKFPQSIYVKVTNNYGCSNTEKVTLYTQEVLALKFKEFEETRCDEDYDGITTFNLYEVAKNFTDNSTAKYKFYYTYEDASKEVDEIDNAGAYINKRSPLKDKIYFRVSASGYCPAWGKIKLKVILPPIHDLPVSYKICPNGSIELNAGTNPDIVSYEWGTNNGKIVTDNTKHTITVETAGTYWVKLVGNNGCPITIYTEVTEHDKVVIKDLDEGKDYITVIAEGPSPLEYSMDQVNWQSNSTFGGLEPGVYTFYVRSLANECYSLDAKGVLFKIHNTITPNGDGYNDKWKMCGLEHFNGKPSQIKIYDRLGRVVFEESSTDCFIWDGYYIGRQLPTTSYWYVVDIADGRQFTGWILLRNYD